MIHGKIVSVDVPDVLPLDSEVATTKTHILAFTNLNAVLHRYVEGLSQLLIALDSVETDGVMLVWEKRRAVIQLVDDEAKRLDRHVSAVWGIWLHDQDDQATEIGEVQILHPLQVFGHGLMVIWAG